MNTIITYTTLTFISFLYMKTTALLSRIVWLKQFNNISCYIYVTSCGKGLIIWTAQYIYKNVLIK